MERLVSGLFEGLENPPVDRLGAELLAWALEAPRFRVFVEVYRDKIRKKLRGAADLEARLDVRTELRAARLLLADRRIELTFEPYGSGKPGPDFRVAFQGELPFNLEVTRVRGTADTTSIAWHVLGKLRQLPPSVPNALALSVEADAANLEVAKAVRALRSRADRKDEAFFTGRGLDGSRGFYDRFLRLGAVFVWTEADGGGASMWANASARIAVPPKAARACVACLSGRQ